MFMPATLNLAATSPTPFGGSTAGVPLLADMGTALMHGTCVFLVIGSLLIGIGEAALLSRCFRLDAKRTKRWMIGANYTSALIGLFAIPGLHRVSQATVFTGAPLYTIRPEYYVLLAASFLLTIFIEWPFCAATFERGQRRWKRTLGASLLAQTASYVVLSPLYVWLADYSVVAALSPDRSLSFVPSDLAARVYYISAEDGDVCSVGLDGGNRRREYDIDDSLAAEKVYGAQGDEGNGNLLWLLLEHGHAEDRVVLGPLPGTPGVPIVAASARDPHESADDPRCVWDLRPSDEREWQFRVVPWSGWRITCKRGAETISLRYETTYDAWSLENLTAIRGGLIVFEAEEQILVADLEERKIGVAALGRGPCVVLEEDLTIVAVSGP